MTPYMIRSIYYTNLQSRLRYGTTFWAGYNESKNIFKLQNKGIQIISVVSKCISCRQTFMDYNILTMASLYILEVICYLKKYKDSKEQNVHIHMQRKLG